MVQRRLGDCHINPEISRLQSSVSNRIRLSPDSNQQELDVNFSGKKSHLGLKLTKTPSFVDLIEKTLSQARSSIKCTSTDQKHHFAPVRDTRDSEKLKASNFPALLLKIGDAEWSSRHEGDLIAKCYYAKRKIVWEILDGGLKSKFEIQWSNIEGMRAIICDDETGVLELELNEPPQFFQETSPQPRKHTVWQHSADFTGGQASICRRHYVRFSPGVLEKHYEKLLQKDQHLLEISKKPFPRLDSPYFCTYLYSDMDIPFDFRLPCAPSAIPVSLVPPQPAQNFELGTGPPFGTVRSDLPMSVTDYQWRDENMNDYAFDDQRTVHWGPEENNLENILTREYQMRGLAEACCNNVELANLENHLLGETNYECPAKGDLLTRLWSALLESSEYPGNRIGNNQLECKEEKFSHDDSILVTNEHCELEGGLINPKPINWLPPQVPNENLMVQLPSDDLSYPYNNNSGVFGVGQEVDQWW
ncbi:uncharacterized protein LOC130758228 [Actinidia eriantha]|uniref:uncharacterized protein LOC130758228 n=1 Tax=Actinidia eriantha TaxID=165200 RepID=UPI00258D9575|nr:uncharacterized protein LOC130758228 [Actinidia eriantha]